MQDKMNGKLLLELEKLVTDIPDEGHIYIILKNNHSRQNHMTIQLKTKYYE